MRGEVIKKTILSQHHDKETFFFNLSTYGSCVPVLELKFLTEKKILWTLVLLWYIKLSYLLD